MAALVKRAMVIFYLDRDKLDVKFWKCVSVSLQEPENRLLGIGFGNKM
jgi:hypothetical protein